jgi:glutaredoxin
MRVVIYSKPNCSLCDAMKAQLQRARADVEFSLDEVDITSDAKLFERFRYDIPVLFIDGQKAFKLRVDDDALLRRLRRATVPPGG